MEDEIVKFYLRLNQISEELKKLSHEIEQINLDFIQEVVVNHLCSVSEVEFD